MSHPIPDHEFDEETTGEIPDLKDASYIGGVDFGPVEKGLSYEDSVDREHDAQIDLEKARDEHFAPSEGPVNFGGESEWK